MIKNKVRDLVGPFNWVKWGSLGLVLIFLLQFRLFTNVSCSMEPDYCKGCIMLACRYRQRPLNRFDIVIVDLDDDITYLKRVIGLPGDEVTIKDRQLTINGEVHLDAMCYNCEDQRVQLSDNSYFLLGDNHENSLDSRNFGPVDGHRILYKVVYKLWPPKPDCHKKVLN